MKKFARYLENVRHWRKNYSVPIQSRIPPSDISWILNVNTVPSQVRIFSQHPSSEKCWNCQKYSNQMICDECGHLQDIKSNYDYFEIFSVPRKFYIDGHDLTKRFRNLQTMVHPDKFSNKSEREQINSAEWSSLINKAYKTLLTPIERGQYLLQSLGEKMPTDNSALDKKFLIDMMERNEEVEAAETSDQLVLLNEKIIQELNEHAKHLIEKFDEKSFESVKSILVKMKYLISIQNAIKKKHEEKFQ